MELDLRVRAGDRYKHTGLGEVVQLCEGVVNKGRFFFLGLRMPVAACLASFLFGNGPLISCFATVRKSSCE
jgi:hypothetical protein